MESLPNKRTGIQFLTSDRSTARDYQEQHSEVSGENAVIREYFAYMKNPLSLIKMTNLEQDRENYYGYGNRYTSSAYLGPWDFAKLHDVLTEFRNSKYNNSDKRSVNFDPKDEKHTREYGGAGQLDDYVRNKDFYEQNESEFEDEWNQFASFLKSKGYDGIIGQHHGSIEYIALSPSHMKSADVTYDDDGKLIPLSRRFDFTSDDIRY